MTGKALEYCARGIVQYLDGNVNKFKQLVSRAMKIHDDALCECGESLVQCRYEGKRAELCTGCGKLWINGEMVRKC